MSNALIGEYSHSIDSKGRVIVPAKFREALGESFVITMGFDGNLCMYSDNEWEKFVEKLNSLPESQKEVRQLVRLFFARAGRCEIDKQGRILVPVKLREHASLIKDVVFIGSLSKVELWSKERWDAANDDDADALAEALNKLGISF